MKKLWQRYMVAFFAIPFGIMCITATMFYSVMLAVCEALALVLLCTFYIWQIKTGESRITSRITGVFSQLEPRNNSSLDNTPFLVVSFDSDGTVFWNNKAFSNEFFPDGRVLTTDIKDILSAESMDSIINTDKIICDKTGRHYSSFCSEYLSLEGEKEYILYLSDETQLVQTEKKLNDTRLSVILVRVDNADEVYQNFKESECGAIFGRIEEIISTWANKNSSLCRKLSSSRFIIFAEEQNLKKMIEDKFKILEYVRNLSYADKKINTTLSVGIGKAEDLPSSDEAAKLALDMAQSRGGDQVAIKDGTEYTFFGGLSGGFDRSNKIKARQIASSLSQLISSCENVMIMGHRFADLDAFGSALGVAAIAKSFSKQVNIVIDKETALATPLIKKAEESLQGGLVVSPDKAEYMVSENTVLVVVDTHRKDFTECPSLLSKTKNIVIIDHHRKSVDSISDSVIFFLSPVASSAAEMVTELCQYVTTKPVIDPLTAQALLSGITLDTKNFVLRTGVRTFEAAAYLRSKGADTVEVRKMFSNDAEINKQRNQIVDDSFGYKDCAISVAGKESSKIRLVTSQAADELLNLEGVKASFVIFRVGETVCISARSFGEMNVQVIMEKFGGGGHATMAASQTPDTTEDEILEKLKKEIDSYYENI